MRRAWGIFCGGPALYGDAVPKPLMPVAERTLLHWYLSRLAPDQVSSICLLGDHEYGERLMEEARAAGVEASVLTSAVGASTLERARLFLTTQNASADVCLTYPDVFAQDRLDPVVEGFDVFLSVTALKSRFPRIHLDPYTHEVRSISNHTSPVPANPVHIFGGHIIGKAGTLRQLLHEFVSLSHRSAPTLEIDFFGWLINGGQVGAIPLFGDWFQVDSPRDVSRLEGLLAR